MCVVEFSRASWPMVNELDDSHHDLGARAISSDIEPFRPHLTEPASILPQPKLLSTSGTKDSAVVIDAHDTLRGRSDQGAKAEKLKTAPVRDRAATMVLPPLSGRDVGQSRDAGSKSQEVVSTTKKAMPSKREIVPASRPQSSAEASAVPPAAACSTPRDWTDVDALNKDDPLAVSEYAELIFQHLRESEINKRPSSSYLERVQVDVNAKMRAILVDWLVEVAEEYTLCADTLYQAVHYIDRFLTTHVTKRNQLQLVGVTCMWLSSKYEEIFPPTVSDFCFITDNTYTKEELVAMEEVVLKELKYELTAPTAKTFLRRLLQVCFPDELLHFLSNYLTELSLLDYAMLRFLPSTIAASAVYLANVMLGREPWSPNLRHYSTYVPEDIRECVLAMAAVHKAATACPSLAAIRTKYAHPRFHEVSMIAPVTASEVDATL